MTGIDAREAGAIARAYVNHARANSARPKNFNDRPARNASKGHIFIPDVDTVTFVRKSIKHQAILSWNYLTDIYPEENFLSMP